MTQALDAMVHAMAPILAEARGCLDDGGSASQTGVPCPFCNWTDDAGDESGCVFWAEKAARAGLEAIREPADAISASDPNVDLPYWFPEAFSAVIDKIRGT